MKYIVSRTSQWDDEIKPCEESFKSSYIRIDERNTDDPVKIGRYKGNKELANKDWYGEGKNHRVENGHIKRDYNDETWFVEINDLQQLNEFIDKYGDIVIQKSYNNPEIFEIEIYDDYRE